MLWHDPDQGAQYQYLGPSMIQAQALWVYNIKTRLLTPKSLSIGIPVTQQLSLIYMSPWVAAGSGWKGYLVLTCRGPDLVQCPFTLVSWTLK